MQLRFVEIFCAVVEERSFSNGARAQGVTQSAASQAVSNLERKLGAQLIDRSKRPFELTPAGQIYYEGCRQLLVDYRSLEDRVRGAASRVIGRVRVAAIYSVGLMQMERFVRRFEDQFPDVVLRLEYLHPDRVYEQVLAEQADLGLVSYPKNRADLISIPWQDQPMVLVASTRHPLAKLPEVPAARLEGVAFLAFTRELPIRREIDLWLRRHQVEVELHHEFDNIETIKKAVECGSGVSILPLATVSNEVAAGELVALPLAGEPLFRPLGIIHKKNRQQSTAVQKFVQLLKQGLDFPEDSGQNLEQPAAPPAAAWPSPLIAGPTVGAAAESAGTEAADRRKARRKPV